MIWLDGTKSTRARHHSGLMRVSSRLLTELGDATTSVSGVEWVGQANRDDWFLTAEVFSPSERKGWNKLLESRPCKLAAIFHDAIPMKFPQTTWPQSVARHPAYLKMLSRFDRVWAVSETSRRELVGYWDWLGLVDCPPVTVLSLGADFDGEARQVERRLSAESKMLLNVAILEPRKNQILLLDACEQLWGEGEEFELHLVGRVNPHYGRSIEKRVKQMRKIYPALHYHAAAGDETVAELYSCASAAVFPTKAEGCGLPVMESLWRGIPCVCSDLPVLRENTNGGGCLTASPDDLTAWIDALRRVLTDDGLYDRLSEEARTRPLVTWKETAATIRAALG